VWRFLFGGAGRFTAKNGGFRPGPAVGCLGFNHFPILLALAWCEDPRLWLPACQAVQVGGGAA
jgi:hypothetical protein